MNSIVRLQRDFYSHECVTQALVDFHEYMDGGSAVEKGEIVLNLEVRPPFSDQARLIVREFLNYALDLTLRARFAGESG